MAKITKLPGMDIIAGFRGVLDFYVHCGQACVRSWPSSPGRDRAPAVESGWPAFAYAASNWNSLSPEIRRAYERMASGTTMSGRDAFTKSYISAMYLRLE